MKCIRGFDRIRIDMWRRYENNLTFGLGENGRRLTGGEEHCALAKRIADEGMVLLQNNGVLPLKEGSRVAMFGIGSVDYVKGGGGSGYVFSDYVHDMYEGFERKAPRFSVYMPLTQFYWDYAVPKTSHWDANTLCEEQELPQELLDDARKEADVAIITIHRFFKEDVDRKAEKGDYYLSDAEQKLVDEVTARFDNCVVVLNVGAVTDVSWIVQNPKIGAVLMAWNGGVEGGYSMADILCGDVNPSGKSPDTFTMNYEDFPFTETFTESDDYVNYYEDIYVGYRYFETLPGADKKVVYPFGHGLSYTTFEMSDADVSEADGMITVKVSVKNTGAMAGKEVAQVYVAAPQGVLGKAAKSLVAFKKTDLLAPGEQQELVMTFPVSEMASYDDLGKLQMSAYVLEGGEYRFFVGNSVRNVKEAAWRYVVTEKFVVTEQLSAQCAPNKLEKRMLADGSFEALPSFPIVEREIEPYINPAGPLTPAEAQFVNPAEPLNPNETHRLWEVVAKRITLDQFMTQLTDDELLELLLGRPSAGVSDTCGVGNITRLWIPRIMTVDGPAGLRIWPWVGITATAFPCATLLAATWNTDLAEEMGRAGAIEAKENGIGIWLTPALNIHRNPLCGRNFEYFSEDPLLAGKFAAAEVRGIQSQRVSPSVKHFACNNKEVNRYHSDSRVSERAMREIYMRGFEICVKEADPYMIMLGYNIINGRRCCESYEQVTGILRDEWGYKGMVTSDWGTPCDQVKRVLAGVDLFMPMRETALLRVGLEDGRLKRGHLEACAKHILEMIIKLA